VSENLRDALCLAFCAAALYVWVCLMAVLMGA